MLIYGGSLQNTRPPHQPSALLKCSGYHQLTDEDRRDFEDFFAAAIVLPIYDEVIRRAVSLRQERKMTLGDALIAGTALARDLTLVTRNTDDFKWIEGLRLLNPLAV